MYGYGWCVGRVQDSGLSGVWVGLVYRVCCVGGPGLSGVWCGNCAGHIQDLGLSGVWVGQFCRMCWGHWTFRCMDRAVV